MISSPGPVPTADDRAGSLGSPDLGMSTAMRRSVRLLKGRGQFVGDVQLSKQASMVVVRSPMAHARIVEVDTSLAETAPGVVAVYTAQHVGDVRIPIRRAHREGMEAHLQPVLALDIIHYVGEPIAIVVAENEYLAEDAADLVAVDMEPLEAQVVADGRAATERNLYSVRANFGSFGFAHADGSAADNGDSATSRAELELGVQRHTGCPMETRGIVADWDSQTSCMRLWGPTKYVYTTQQILATMLKLDAANVVCESVDVGGMFGVRGEVYPEDFLVPWAARQLGRPVRWIEDRREHLLSTNHARQTSMKVGIACRNGMLHSLDASGYLDLGAYSRPVGSRLGNLLVEALHGPYAWSEYHAGVTGVLTNKTPVGTMRGPSTFEATFFRERAIDVLARRVGLDPWDLRISSLIPEEAMPYRIDMGPDLPEDVTFDTGDYRAMTELVSEHIGLPGIREIVANRKESGEHVGVGYAMFNEHSGKGANESVGLELDEEGQFKVLTSASDVGQGLDRMAAGMVADAMGVSSLDVAVRSGTTRGTPPGMGSFSSRATIFVGSALTNAASKLCSEASLRAGELLDSEVHDVTVVEDGIVVNGEQFAWKELAPLSVVGHHHAAEPTFGFGIHIAVVAVDPDTAQIAIERLHAAYDCGRAIDVPGATGQLVGAAIMGVGGTLYENLEYDAQGQPQSTTFMDYIIPGYYESPNVTTQLIESSTGLSHPVKVKGVGEAGIVGVAASIANALEAAVYDTDLQSAFDCNVLPLRAT